jgi:hypothetical protein
MTLGEFQGKLHGYREEFLQCKDVRHRWEVVEPYRREKKLVQRVLECQRCGTQRIDNYVVLGSQRLARQGSSYRYPRGFSLRGLPKVDHVSEIVRYESYLRSVRKSGNQ